MAIQQATADRVVVMIKSGTGRERNAAQGLRLKRN